MPEEAPRRFLIATGVTVGLPKTGDRIAESVDMMSALFQEKLGYERATSLGLNPSAKELQDELREFAKKCNPGDIVTLYYTGHGDVVNSRHRLWMGDNTGDRLSGTLPTSELAERMLTDTPLSNLLIILDVCFAGQGGAEALLTGMQVEGATDKILVVITAAHPREQVLAGDFARLFVRSVEDPATAGHEPHYMTLDAILRHIENDLERKKWQTVSYNTLFLTHDPGFLPNPRYDTVYHGYDLAAQLQMEQDAQRREDLEKFFNPRARGVHVPQEAGWNFVGRHAALRDITAWLVDHSDQRTIVVIGDPGSGKSAVIGRLYVLSLPDWGRAAPRQGLSGDTIPPTGSIDVAIRASNRTSKEILGALCSAARVTAETPGEFLRAMAGKPMVAAIDAIDEALDPYELVAGVLNPLVKAGSKAGFRMLLGTRSRSYSLDLLSSEADRIDLDDERYADTESMRLYAEGRLRAADGSPYATADATTVRTVAEAIADAAGRSFLVTLITSRTQAARQVVADPTDQAWRDSLPGTAAEAMQQDLEARLGADAARARDLLRPLAYARGNGLPWEDLWAPLASLLAEKEYLDDDLIWLRQHAGSYVVEALESGRSVYRLYHAALAEYLRHGQDEKRLNAQFARFLLGHVPRAANRERAWPDAHPYILSHLATHAAAAGELAELILDPGYLACAAPPGLLAAFATAQDSDTRLVAAAYERAMHQLRSNDIADRLSYLELAARRGRAVTLAERIKMYPVPRRWSVSWTQWPPEYPHRVLTGHRGPVREVVGISATERAAQAASVGDDGTLRLWDLGAAEPLVVHEVSRASLIAIDLVQLPGPRHLAVVLSASGFLTAHELPSMSLVLDVPIQSRRRRVLRSLQSTAPEMRCVRLPDGRLTAVTGGPGVMTTIWDIEAGTPIVRLPAGLRPGRLEFRRLASGSPVVVSIDISPPRGASQQVFDLATGSPIPNNRRMFRSINLTYYCREDGTPLIALQNRFSPLGGRQALFDLTSPSGEAIQIDRKHQYPFALLKDGTRVWMVSDERAKSFLPFGGAQGDQELAQLSDTAHGLDGGSPSSMAIHARPKANFPFVVTLDGRAITLSPARSAVVSRQPVVLTGHSAQVTDADVVAGVAGELAGLVSSSLDGTVRHWDITPGIEAATPSSDLADDPLTAVVATLTHQGRTLGVAATTTKEKDIAILDLDTGSTIARLNCTSGSVWAAVCGWVPEVGDAVITFHDYNIAQIWRLPDGDPVAFFRVYTDRVPVQAAYVPLHNRPLAITCGHGDKAIIWDLVDRRIHNVLGKHTGWTSTVTCGTTSKGTLVAATGGHDNRVNIWNVMRGRRVGRLKIVTRMNYLRRPDSGHAAAVSLVTIEDHRDIVLVLCEDGKLKLFQKRRWRPGYRGALLGGNGASSLAVMRLTDGRTVAVTSGQDGRVCAWDLDVAITAIGSGEINIPTLVEIETEVDITGLSVAENNTIITSSLNGLAALRLHPECLPG
jgi:WD40 repeat protein